jgi:pteridine reductase
MLALACARAGADLLVHHAHSAAQAGEVQAEIESYGRRARVLAADLSTADGACALAAQAAAFGPLHALVNSAAIFEPRSFAETDLSAWDRHMALNLTTPFLLSREFAKQLPSGTEGRIVNILDWRALRPGSDHFPYTVSKAALAAMTKSMAIALAPRITVNGLALGAVLPPLDGSGNGRAIEAAPAGRWCDPHEVGQALVFLLAGPAYVTGEILHLDGGRHLV